MTHQTDGLQEDIRRVWGDILSSGRFVSGEHVETFETSFAAAHETHHAVAVSNGTVALELALRALGVQVSDQVIVPANSFIASAECVSNVGGTPVFVDIDPTTANVDLEAVRTAIGPKTVGVIGVHLYGAPCDARSLRAICDAHGLFLLEDAAQAHLAEIDGKPVGGFGDVSSFSFYPGKNLGAPGEGGILITNDLELRTKLRALRNHGESERYQSQVVGTNARMAEMTAAVLSLKLPRLPGWTQQRRDIADLYEKTLGISEAISLLRQPEWAGSVFHVFSVEVDERESVREALSNNGVETGLHYPIPIHLQKAYQELGYGPGSMPATEARARRLMSLPMFPGLDVSDVELIASALFEAVGIHR